MDGIDRHKPLTLILPRYKGIQSRMGTETVQEVNKAERYTLVLDLTPEDKEEPPLVLELASESEVYVNHTTRTGRVYQPPHLQG